MKSKLILAMAFWIPVIGVAQERYRPFTTLRAAGNVEVAERYQSFLDSGQACVPVNGGPRVILTGFGIWNDRAMSYSGYLIDNLSSVEFWPEENSQSAPPEDYAAKNGVLNNEGTRVVNRAFKLDDGRDISACLILVDVLWDFAGAVVAAEMDRFQPQAVLMMGVGPQATIEGGASNSAFGWPGYINGDSDPLNVPEGKSILPNFPADSTIPMTWNVARIAEVVAPFEPGVIRHDEASPGNDYICNNISYIALQAAAGEALELADGKLNLKLAVRSHPQVGFYHFKSSTSGDTPTLRKYAKMVLAMAGAMLGE